MDIICLQTCSTSGAGNYGGTCVAVFNRNAMLTGGAATMQRSFLPTSTWSFLPSDCDGVAPPSGAPNYFLSYLASI